VSASLAVVVGRVELHVYLPEDLRCSQSGLDTDRRCVFLLRCLGPAKRAGLSATVLTLALRWFKSLARYSPSTWQSLCVRSHTHRCSQRVSSTGRLHSLHMC